MISEPALSSTSERTSGRRFGPGREGGARGVHRGIHFGGAALGIARDDVVEVRTG